MNKYLRLIYLLLFLLSFNTLVVKAQTQADFGSEEEFKKQAAKLFDEEEFVKAYPLYTQLVSLYKKDPDYNYRLGVCMIYSIQDKEKAIPYLEFALRTPDKVDKEAYFYLAKAFHLTYRFDDAIKRYQAYKKIASGAKAERLQVDRQIEMCGNGKRLLQNISDLLVIEKIEMNREDFFRAYDISGIGGKLLVKPDEKEFRTALDKKKKESSIIYLAQNGSQIFFSSYGDNEKNGKDIYVIKKTGSGEWGKPQALGAVINTKYDEDYPFLHPNGKVLYFCSKGHNSMGGYDIFKSTLNEQNNEWSTPVNLDFPVNTPDDDILYITDKDEKKAYFSSARASEAGKIAVYNINVERRPIDFAVIGGTVIRNTKNQEVGSKITIKSLSDNNMIVGMFNANPENGAYYIKLPNGGRFLFTVETPNFLPQSEVVEIPVQTEFKPLRQEISYELLSNKLIIKNFFNEPVADTNYMLALNVIKEKAKLEVVGATDFAVNDTSKTETAATTPVDTAALATNRTTTAGAELSNEDIVRIAYKDAKDSETEAKELREQADISLGLANKKNELARVKQQEAADFTAQASKEDDSAKKLALTEKANAASQEAETLNQETVVAFNLAKKIDATATSKQQEADLSLQYAKGLEAAVKSDNSREAIAKLDELEKKLELLSQSNAASLPIINSFKKDEENKKLELDKATQESVNLKQDMADNETIIAGLQAEAEKEKNDKIKENMNIQIAELKQENIDKQKLLEQNDIRIAKLQKEYISVKNEAALVSSVVDQSKVSDGETVAAQVAAVDKAKLEQQVNTIQSSGTATSTVAVTSTQKTDTVASVAVKTTPSNPADTLATNNTATETGTQFVYADASAGAQINQADNLEKEANELLAESIKYRVEKDDNKNVQKEKRKKSEELAKQAQEKKEAAANLYAEANKTEYTNNQKQLDEAAKANTGSTSPDLFKAELLTDESKKYFDLAQEERNRAKNAKSYSEKEAALDAARSNELIALEKQSEAAGIYKNFTPAATTTTVASVNNTDTAKVKPVNTVVATEATTTAALTPQTTETAMADINTRYQSDLTATQSIQDEADREKAKADVLKRWSEAIDADLAKQKKDYETTTDPQKKEALAKRMTDAENSSKEKQNLALESRTKAETIRQNQVAAANVTPPVNTVKIDTPATNVVINTSIDDTTAAVVYSDPVANEQAEKAVMLNDQADALLAESILPELETTEPISEEERQKRREEAKKKIAEAQSKKLESAQLVATANTSEYSRKQKEISDVAKTTAGNTAPDLLKAEILSDEAQNHFNLAAEERKKAETVTSYYEKEMMLQDANENEMLALKKQNESLALYKNYSPAVAATNTTGTPDVNPAERTTPVNTTTTAAETSNTSTTASANKQFAYSTPSALEQSVKAASLNKQAEDIMTLSLDLKTQAIAQSNADAKNTMYAQSEELMKEARAKKTEAAQLTADANSSEYASNEGQINQYKSASSGNNAAELLKAELLNDEAQGLFNKAKALRQEAAATDSYFAREATLEDAAASERQALEKQKESIELYKKHTPAIAAATNKTVEKTTPVATAVNPPVTAANTAKTTAEITLAPNESFEQKETVAYSSKNPIPIDAKLPEGLIFKVQIGAFRKPIPQNLFKGMAPITGETTPKGFIRYTAGVFTKFSTADKVKKKIIDMGYKDAFVVAFLNGKRIPINEAYALSEGTPSTVLQTNTQAAVTATTTTPDDQNEVIKSSSVTDVGGLFYTVQVGVFSQEVLASKLYSMKPLYSEKAPNGSIRYYTGTYTSIERAGEAKGMVVDIGIKDAFVTAYYNGKRVSMEEAQKYEAQGATFPKGPEVDKLPSFKAVNKPAVPPRNPNVAAQQQPADNGTKEQLNSATSQNNPLPSGPGIVYKVQIGAFYEEVPLDMANKFLKIAKKGIANYKDNSGLTIYTVGDSKTYEEANTLKAQVIAEAELADAFVVAYKDGKKISIEEAKESKNK
jgi:hypothetical protein